MQTTVKKKALSGKTAVCIQSYMFIIIPLIGFFLLTVYPTIWAICKSWYYYTGVPSATRFVGWDNFKTIFTTDKEYFSTWVTTIKFAVFKLPVELGLAMILALILNKDIKGKGIYRAIFYLPNVISIAVVGLIFSNMFEYYGVINTFLLRIGVIKERLDWFSKSSTAFAALITGDMWKNFGVNVLYFLAALQNVPDDVYESSYLDGAGRFCRFFKITLPLIAPVFQIVLLLAINGALHTNDYVLVTTNGAPGGTTHTVMSYLTGTFAPGFADNGVNIGYGCAMSFITSVIMSAIAIVYSKVSSKMSDLY